MTTLVTGATGTVSRSVLAELSASGIPTRALVRDPAAAPDLPGVDVVVGDLEKPATLADAFDGVDQLWLLTAMGPTAPHASSNAVWAARHAGVRHVVRLSAIGAAHDAPTRNGRLHALSDAELAASGLAWTVLRPAFYLQNLLGSVIDDTLAMPVGTGRVGMVDTRDVGAMGAAILADPAPHAGRVYTPTGPARVGMDDVVAAVSDALGSRVSYVPVSPDDAVAGMRAAGVPEWIAEVNGEYGVAYSAGWGDLTTSHVPDVLGRPARGVAEFARDHAAALRLPAAA